MLTSSNKTQSSNNDIFKDYWQTILQSFPELTSNNIDILRQLLANNTTHFSKVHVRQY